MSITLVRLSNRANPAREILVYAALDTLSSACFITEDVMRSLNISGEKSEITIKTVVSGKKVTTVAVTGLQVSPYNGGPAIQLPRTFTQPHLPMGGGEIPTREILQRWPHLAELTDVIPEYDESVPIGLLIGADYPRALQPHKVIASENDGPFAMQTSVGWCVSGPATKHVKYCDKITCNRIQVEESSLKEMCLSMYEMDFNESFSLSDVRDGRFGQGIQNAMSHEDKLFLNIMNKEVKFRDGRYQLPLPFRNPECKTKENRDQAVKRTLGLKVRFAKDSKFREDYARFMNDIISKGFAEANTESLADQCWYIPHHGVYHPKKPDKIRVVFDCACSYHEFCLNKELLQGPNLTNSLVGVLAGFRMEQVAFMADIDSMFYQVRIPENQRSFVRFLWWPNGDTESELQDYQMCVHLFGCISSPSCANFALKKTADDMESRFGKEAADTLRRNFYVDDLLKSSDTPRSAQQLLLDVKDMCAAGGFHLSKFMSSDRSILELIPVGDRAKGLKSLDFAQVSLPVERALGVCWCMENDTFGFRITLRDNSMTRRGILSTICSIYDPLGFAAPFLLKAKQILQELCDSKLGWDDPIGEERCFQWQQWRSGLIGLQKITVDRCFKPPGFGCVISSSLHHFSDASQSGYGECSYLRLVDDAGRIHCSLLMGKSRVTPMKPVTIPRLELTAATVSVRVGTLLKSELNFPHMTETYWTDSKVVLGYLTNDVRRFKLFVANRVQLMRDATSIQDWRYVDSRNNPADDASRGLDCCVIFEDHRWFKGPEFLWQAEESWPPNRQSFGLVGGDPEVKTSTKVTVAVTIKETNFILKLAERVSDWFRLKKLVAIWICFVRYLKFKSVPASSWTVDDLQSAELAVLRMVQSLAFPDELRCLRETRLSSNESVRQLKRSNHLFRLNPIIDEHGILRVGGRMRNSSLSEENKHPIILPQRNHVTDMLVRWYHQRVKHAGRGIILNEIRNNGYWIVSANMVVRRLIYSCVVCRSLRGKFRYQKVADLPVDRVDSAPPFTYCGVDLFGPFVIRDGRRDLKRYGCIFTCLSCRAVHIETTNSADTDSLINALRRFISRRGNVRLLRSDNGTNFVGAETEIKKATSEQFQSDNSPRIDIHAVKNFLLQKGTDFMTFQRNVPTASHMGGVWERQIRSVREILACLLKQHGHVLDDELFRTFLTEVEAVVNSRPLTVDALSDADAALPLSPCQLLTMKSKVVLPLPGVFPRTDLYCRRRWRRVQHLANEFWNRWKKEYLASLQSRPRNNCKQRNFQIGDIVLLRDESLCRNDWPMAKVVDVKFDDAKDCVRSVRLLMSSRDSESRYKERPVNKITLLLESETESEIQN